MSQLVEQDELYVELALPPRDGCLAVPWPTCTELIEPRGEVFQRTVYAPSPDNRGTISLFPTEDWLVWYYSFGHDVPGPRISSMCNLYTSHLL